MSDLKNALAKKANGNITTQDKPKTIYDFIKAMAPEIQKAIPKHLDTNRLARIVMTEIRNNPKLGQCSKESLLGALMLSAQLGVEPGPLGLCYYIPFKNQCQFILGYRGMIDLARRSGAIESIYAETVHENDEFDYELGLDPKITHKPTMEDRGEPIAFYAVAKFKDGGFQLKLMSKAEVNKHRSRSKAAESGPWVTDYSEMAKKTVVRAMFKYLPISIELMEMAEKDSVVKTEIGDGVGEIKADYIEVEAEEHAAA